MIPSIREALLAWVDGPPPDDEEAFHVWTMLNVRVGNFDAWADLLG